MGIAPHVGQRSERLLGPYFLSRNDGSVNPGLYLPHMEVCCVESLKASLLVQLLGISPNSERVLKVLKMGYLTKANLAKATDAKPRVLASSATPHANATKDPR